MASSRSIERSDIEPGRASRGNVLVIEDEAIIALDIANDIETWSYDVIGVVHSMKQAIAVAERTRPDFVIADIMLNGDHDGIEIAEALKARFNTKIIFLTANSDPTMRARIVKLAPIGYLFKPYSAYALRQLLETFETN